MRYHLGFMLVGAHSTPLIAHIPLDGLPIIPLSAQFGAAETSIFSLGSDGKMTRPTATKARKCSLFRRWPERRRPRRGSAPCSRRWPERRRPRRGSAPCSRRWPERWRQRRRWPERRRPRRGSAPS